MATTKGKPGRPKGSKNKSAAVTKRKRTYALTPAAIKRRKSKLAQKRKLARQMMDMNKLPGRRPGKKTYKSFRTGEQKEKVRSTRQKKIKTTKRNMAARAKKAWATRRKLYGKTGLSKSKRAKTTGKSKPKATKPRTSKSTGKRKPGRPKGSKNRKAA